MTYGCCTNLMAPSIGHCCVQRGFALLTPPIATFSLASRGSIIRGQIAVAIRIKAAT